MTQNLDGARKRESEGVSLPKNDETPAVSAAEASKNVESLPGKFNVSKSTKTAAVRQHVRTNEVKPLLPVQWSTGDLIIRQALDDALPKLIAAGANPPDAITVLQGVSKAAEAAEDKLQRELGEIEAQHEVDCLSSISLHMQPGELVPDILGDAKRLMRFAGAIGEAASTAEDARLLSQAVTFLAGMAESYIAIAQRACVEGRSHG